MQNLLPRITYFLKDFAPYLILIFLASVAFIIAAYKIFKSQISQRKKNLMLALCAAVFSLSLVFSGFETYSRYVYDESDGLGFLQVNERWHKRNVVYNSYFFRDRDFDGSKKEGVIRIGVLGDSITLGAGIKDVQNRFSNILERKLRDSGYNVEVYNLGKSGYDTEAEIEVYNKVKSLNFDLIVWQYYINDIQPKDSSTGTKILERNGQKAKIIKFVSNTSFFLDYLYWRFSSVYTSTIVSLRTADIDQYKDKKVLAQHKENITSFINSLKSENKKIAVVMFPSIDLIDKEYPTFINDIMISHFRENGIEPVDLLEYLRGQNPEKLMASRFDSHPNEEVHRLAADKIYEKVLDLLNTQ